MWQDGLIFHFLQTRGTADPSFYPAGRFRSEFAEQLDRHYREKLFGTRSMWLNQTFLVLHLSPRLIGGKTHQRLLPGRWRGGQPNPRASGSTGCGGSSAS